jgi:hypothetical protein
MRGLLSWKVHATVIVAVVVVLVVVCVVFGDARFALEQS